MGAGGGPEKWKAEKALSREVLELPNSESNPSELI